MKAVRPLKAIRLKCLDCSGWSSVEVDKCAHIACVLYPLRYGRKPKGVAYTKMDVYTYQKQIETA